MQGAVDVLHDEAVHVLEGMKRTMGLPSSCAGCSSDPLPSALFGGLAVKVPVITVRQAVTVLRQARDDQKVQSLLDPNSDAGL